VHRVIDLSPLPHADKKNSKLDLVLGAGTCPQISSHDGVGDR
jgi:hypothetical protein